MGELWVVYHFHGLGKLFGSLFGQLVSKIPYCDIPFWDWCLQFAQIPPIYRQRESVTGIKNRGLRNGTRIYVGTFHPGKQDYLFRRSIIPGNFLFERPEKLCSIDLNQCRVRF